MHLVQEVCINIDKLPVDRSCDYFFLFGLMPELRIKVQYSDLNDDDNTKVTNKDKH